MSKKMNERIIRLRPIPSNSKYKYCDFVVPVYETDKISKEELNQYAAGQLIVSGSKLQPTQKMTTYIMFLPCMQVRIVILLGDG